VKVLHLFRSPVGGLFRHVNDLVRIQAESGLSTGIICDSETGYAQANHVLAELDSICDLGVHRISIGRMPEIADITTFRNARQLCQEIKPDIIHGHGAKGGAFSRLLSKKSGARNVYTPHGGTLHYESRSLAGTLFFGLERYLRDKTDAIIFESQFSADAYVSKVGQLQCDYRIIHNGLTETELTASDHQGGAVDFLFLGEFRRLKGVDVFLNAVAAISKERSLSVIVAGAGHGSTALKARIDVLGLQDTIELSPPIYPATAAFKRAKCMVVPSRAESLPYTVLEAAASGIPLITTNVGGIPEIYGPYSERLVPPNNAEELSAAMREVLTDPETTKVKALELKNRIRSSFRIDNMEASISNFYQDILASPS
jgi:glycosyltransferase involved in cell wall biosynthesis